ncbi:MULTISPECIES: hypothetical protein [Paraburkholderia]|nr:hypothetical protein [Paraburkholderia fungorum]
MLSSSLMKNCAIVVAQRYRHLGRLQFQVTVMPGTASQVCFSYNGW